MRTLRVIALAAAVTTLAGGCGLPSASPGAGAGAGAGAGHGATRVERTTGPSPSSPTSTPALQASWSLSPAEVRAASLALGRLPVKGRAPRTGYDRSAFGPPWTDDVDVAGGHNGCDTRNDVLRRDLSATRLRPGTRGCVVLSGVLADPYTGRTLGFVRGRSSSAQVQIDHVVALGDAWVTGAQQLPASRRAALANDPLELLAVDGRTNSAKRDADAASWLPPNKAFRCAYVARQVAVKARYGLWVTAAEKASIARVLGTCR